jgi:hypothetical protein
MCDVDFAVCQHCVLASFNMRRSQAKFVRSVRQLVWGT